MRDDQQPPSRPTRKSSKRASPSTSRSLVGSSSSRRSTWLSRIAASAARASSPPESVAVVWGEQRRGRVRDRPAPRRPALEVRPADREVVVERSGIRVVRATVGAPAAMVRQGCRGTLHGSLGSGDARTPGQVLPERLAGPAVALLGKEADRRVCGMNGDAADVGLLEAGDEPQAGSTCPPRWGRRSPRRDPAPTTAVTSCRTVRGTVPKPAPRRSMLAVDTARG